jgi:hypothetical protein
LAQTYEFEPGSPITVKDAREMILDRMGDEVFLAVELKETSKMIGHLYLNQEGPEKFGTRELGYIFNPLYHKGTPCGMIVIPTVCLRKISSSTIRIARGMMELELQKEKISLKLLEEENRKYDRIIEGKRVD